MIITGKHIRLMPGVSTNSSGGRYPGSSLLNSLLKSPRVEFFGRCIQPIKKYISIGIIHANSMKVIIGIRLGKILLRFFYRIHIAERASSTYHCSCYILLHLYYARLGLGLLSHSLHLLWNFELIGKEIRYSLEGIRGTTRL